MITTFKGWLTRLKTNIWAQIVRQYAAIDTKISGQTRSIPKAPRSIATMTRILQPLYDYITVDGSQGVYKFFQKNNPPPTQSNLAQAQRLPYPLNFEITAIRLVTSLASEADANKLLNESWFRLFVGNKDYLVVNSFMLAPPPPCCDDCGKKSTDVVRVSCGRADARGIYVLAEPVNLISGQSFHAELNFPKDATFEKPVKVGVYLDGHFKREELPAS